jgi:hypothetical protein
MGGAAIVIAVIVIRALLSSQGSGDGNSGLAVRPVFIGNIVRAALGLVAFGMVVVGEVVPWGVAFAFLSYPTPALNHLLVPLGIPGLAFTLTRLVRPPQLGFENPSAAVFYELRARLRWGFMLRPEQRRRLGLRLFADASWRARGTSIAARALLDALDGDLDQARAMFSLAATFEHAPRDVKSYCQAWLMADAAARGDYVELLRVSERGPRTSRARFLGACARRILGFGIADRRLYWLWLLAPARRQGLRLMQLARSTPWPDPAPPLEPGFGPARDALVQLQAAGAVTREQVTVVAVAWDTLLRSGELEAQLAERLSKLDSNADPARLAGEVEQEVTELLGEAWQRARGPAGPPPALLLAAIDGVRARLLDELETLVAPLRHGDMRTTDETLEHTRTWAEIRYRSDHYLALFPDEAPTLNDAIGSELWSHAVWLHNRECCYPLSHDLFRWLVAVTPPGDTNLETLRENQQLSAQALENMG